MSMPSYFLLAVSNKDNLELCRKYALAGFTNSYNGAWAYVDIRTGDHVSFLYGARVYDLYQVESKEAIEGDTNYKPWPDLRLRSKLVYSFPFRLCLRRLRSFEESLVVQQFSYVAENLLLRGGYRKTHFQADSTTLHYASEMGAPDSKQDKYDFGEHRTFDPMFTSNKALVYPPLVFKLREIFLQSAIRTYLYSESRLDEFILKFMPQGDSKKFELLSEKALPQGHVDILLKERNAVGITNKVVVEVKLGKAKKEDVIQLNEYVKELGIECKGAALVASDIPKKVKTLARNGIRFFNYSLRSLDMTRTHSFEEIVKSVFLKEI